MANHIPDIPEMDRVKSQPALLNINHSKIAPLIERPREHSAGDITISQLDQTNSYLHIQNSDEKVGFGKSPQPIILSYHDHISIRGDDV